MRIISLLLLSLNYWFFFFYKLYPSNLIFNFTTFYFSNSHYVCEFNVTDWTEELLKMDRD